MAGKDFYNPKTDMCEPELGCYCEDCIRFWIDLKSGNGYCNLQYSKPEDTPRYIDLVENFKNEKEN